MDDELRSSGSLTTFSQYELFWQRVEELSTGSLGIKTTLQWHLLSRRKGEKMRRRRKSCPLFSLDENPVKSTSRVLFFFAINKQEIIRAHQLKKPFNLYLAVGIKVEKQNAMTFPRI